MKHSLETLHVSEVMTTDVKTLKADLSVAEALNQVKDLDFMLYPVLNSENQCVGMITEVRLRRNLAENGGSKKIGLLADKSYHITPDKRLSAAVGRMNNAKARQLAVVSPADRKFIGILTMSDIVRTEAESFSAGQGLDITMTPEFSEMKHEISRSGDKN